ncbi:MAG: chorismate synthase [Candidatus Fimenecus sp.]
MSSLINGNKIKISIFGESHSEMIGCVIDGFPSGVELENIVIEKMLARRAAKNPTISTARTEPDLVHTVSGVKNNITCGTPICALIKNTNTKSSDYDNLKNIPRPSHADYTGLLKYNGFNDTSGGGHFSGRLTAPIVYAGALCLQLLKRNNINIYAHIKRLAKIDDKTFSEVNIKNIDLFEKRLPVIDDTKEKLMYDAIKNSKLKGDSVGGIVECMITGFPSGLGNPMFDGIENLIAKNIFGIPAVKGIEFGSGFECANLSGSQNNDEFFIKNGIVQTKTNNDGGVNGGITNGMPIVFNTAIKPTPSISKKQASVNLTTKKNTVLEIHGRHDPCIVPRAVPVIEAVAAITLADIYLGK